MLKYQRQNERRNLRTRTDPAYKLSERMRRAIGNSLKGNKNGWHWETLVGYTVADLKEHLESQFHLGMSWANYGDWHIDHVIQISAFNFTRPEDLDFKRCWALQNLRPLWAFENQSKGAKLERPFQPTLQLGI